MEQEPRSFVHGDSIFCFLCVRKRAEFAPWISLIDDYTSKYLSMDRSLPSQITGMTIYIGRALGDGHWSPEINMWTTSRYLTCDPWVPEVEYNYYSVMAIFERIL